jgi:hypothetical protein
MSNRFRIDPTAVEWREVDGEVVVLDLKRSEYLAVNKTGTVLWSALAEGADVETLARALVDRFGIDDDQATRDASAFIEDLRGKGLLLS